MEMSYICPYCKRNVFTNLSIHFMEHPCKEYKKRTKEEQMNIQSKEKEAKQIAKN